MESQAKEIPRASWYNQGVKYASMDLEILGPAYAAFGRPLNDPVNLSPLLCANGVSGRSTIAFHEVCRPPTTLRELAMIRAMDSMCTQPGWYNEIKDPVLAIACKNVLLKRCKFSEAMADWCIGEVRHRAAAVTDPANPPPVFVCNGDVYHSNNALSPEFRKAFQAAIVSFEEKIPEWARDWRPDSDGIVWDLVDPSLFPVVYGRTRALLAGETSLEDCISCSGEGVVVPVPLDSEMEETRSMAFAGSYNYSKFQWLPCQVDISGDRARITSYINNLHPVREKDLYALLEKLIQAAIPLWEGTLTALKAGDYASQRIECKRVVWETNEKPHTPVQASVSKVDYEDGDGTKGKQGDEGGSGDADEAEEEEEEDGNVLNPANRRLVYPEPGPFKPLAKYRAFDIKKEYGAAGLQVIVKIFNIQLTPEKPSYSGETWDFEGSLNERIACTALYYLSDENISESTLRFRQQVKGSNCFSNLDYKPGDWAWLPLLYGGIPFGPSVQEIGNVKTQEGRLVTFPNMLQRRIEPFELADPTKPGHRKIVALFLVDPSMTILSSAHVPCQQKEWWWDLFDGATPPNESSTSQQSPTTYLDRLPSELKVKISDAVTDFPIGLSEAKEFRSKLVKEREILSKEHNKGFAELWTYRL